MAHNILAIDRGSKKIGLAWKTSGLSMSFPIGFVMNTGSALDDICSIVEEKNITHIIVGKPFVDPAKNNKRQERMCQLIDIFAEELQTKIGTTIQLNFVDEHYSSTMAGDILGDFTKHVGEDVVAAMKLLEGYIAL